MKELFSLGKLYASDFLKSDEHPRSPPIEMKLMLTNDGNVRLEQSAPLNTMFGRYFYRSNTNASMRNELKNIVESITAVKKLHAGDIWLDIAQNDGTLLSFISKDIIRIGIDPAEQSYVQEAQLHANVIVQDYFSYQAYQTTQYKDQKASVITSIAMFYDLEHPIPFIQDIDQVLDKNGLWVLQLSYTPLMLEQLAFDNICMEHWYYYSLFNLKNLLNQQGFQIMDCQLNDTNGGSFRVYAMKNGADISTFGTQPYRDVCNFRINSLLAYEATLKLDQVETWQRFYQRINELKEQTVSFIKKVKSEGKVVAGYGASTKLNTLLQYFNLDHTMLDYIAERTPYKFGLKTISTNIPIISEEEMRQRKPDYLLLGPWQFLSEFMEREKEFLKYGRFIVAMPKFLIVGGE